MVAITRKAVRFTVKEYLKMDRAGVFDDQRVELVLGRIIKKHAQADPHMWCIAKLSRTFYGLFPPETHRVISQGTLYLGDDGAPDPDLHVFDVPEATAQANLPLPFVVIEVSHKTYRKDSVIKIVQYASAGIAEYWIVNLKARRVEVYRKPGRRADADGEWGYEDVRHYEPGAVVTLLARPDLAIAVDEILP